MVQETSLDIGHFYCFNSCFKFLYEYMNVLRHDELLCNLMGRRMVGNLREAGDGYKC